MRKELEALNDLWKRLEEVNQPMIEDYEILKSTLEYNEKLENEIRELFNNHIELVIEDNGISYYKIKGSKGKEKSFTSKHIAEGILDLLKEMKNKYESRRY